MTIEEALKACAQKDKALESALARVWDGHYSGKGVTKAYAQAVNQEIKAALSHDCGKGYVPREELDLALRACEEMRDYILGVNGHFMAIANGEPIENLFRHIEQNGGRALAAAKFIASEGQSPEKN